MKNLPLSFVAFTLPLGGHFLFLRLKLSKKYHICTCIKEQCSPEVFDCSFVVFMIGRASSFGSVFLLFDCSQVTSVEIYFCFRQIALRRPTALTLLLLNKTQIMYSEVLFTGVYDINRKHVSAWGQMSAILKPL